MLVVVNDLNVTDEATGEIVEGVTCLAGGGGFVAPVQFRPGLLEHLVGEMHRQAGMQTGRQAADNQQTHTRAERWIHADAETNLNPLLIARCFKPETQLFQQRGMPKTS